MSKNKKSIIIFSIIMASIIVVFLAYVFHSLVLYERNLVDNYIGYLLTTNKLTDKVNDDLFSISDLERKNAHITDGVKKLYRSDNLVYNQNKEKSHDDIYVYDIYNNEVLVSTVSLKKTKSYKIMAILTSNEWEIVDYQNYFDHGIYNFTISIPHEYKLYINDQLVSSDYVQKTTDISNLDDLTKFIDIAVKDVYKIDNLVYEPKISILDKSDQKVNYNLKGNTIDVNPEFIQVDTLEEAKKYLKEDFDILALAENYSLFLTDDLGGDRHGLYKLTPYLLEDTNLYDRLVSFSKGPDILMVSTHTFKNPRFTNETLTNFTIYNDNAFSVDVHLEKNMIVSHKDKVDVLNDKFYFIYYENGYKWVKSEAVKK